MMKILILAILFLSPSAYAQDAAKWDALVAAAKKEGKVVVNGPPDAVVRRALPEAFKAKYGITVEYIGQRGSDTTAKMRSERAAGIYTVDVAFGGSTGLATTYYGEKFIAPLAVNCFRSPPPSFSGLVIQILALPPSFETNTILPSGVHATLLPADE